MTGRYGRDWQGMESMPVPREHQCRKRMSRRRVFCERPKGHDNNHRSGPYQWGQEKP